MPTIFAPPISANNAVPFVRTAGNNIPIPNSGKLLGGLGILGAIVGAVDLIGDLGGNKFRDDQLAKLGASYNPNNGLSRAINTAGLGKVTQGVPPFTGGQSVGVNYDVDIRFFGKQSGGQESDMFGRALTFGVKGKFVGVAVSNEPDVVFRLTDGTNTRIVFTLSSPFWESGRVQISNIRRQDGLPDTGGNPNGVGGGAPLYEGYSGNASSKRSQSPLLMPSLSASIGWGNSKPIPINISNVAIGIGVNVNTGVAATPTRRVAPDRVPNSTPKPNQQPKEIPKEQDKKIGSPINPASPLDINSQLFQIGSILGVISANTSPEAQRLNSKNGSCDALNSPSCREGLKNDIKNPLEAKLDAAQIVRDGNAATQTGLISNVIATQATHTGYFTNLITKSGQIFDRVGKLFDNSLINKAMHYVTMITVVHNAAMLSRGIGDTLGSALDQGLQVFGLQAKMEDKDGAITGVNAVLGKSFQNLIKGIIGDANYTALTETWLQANRIYQSGINLLSNVQSILDSTTAVAELTSNRVGTLMNALRSAGAVRENAYAAQSQNTTKFNAFMNKLENLEQGTSNLASITGNIVSVQQSVNELKSNRQEFENSLRDKPAGTGLTENTAEKNAASQKKEQSVYTIGNFSVVRPPEQP